MVSQWRTFLCTITHVTEERRCWEPATSLGFKHLGIYAYRCSDSQDVWLTFFSFREKKSFYVCCNKQVQDLFESESFQYYWNLGVFWLISISHISIWWWQMTTLQWTASKANRCKRHQHFFSPQHLLYACICWPYLCMRVWRMYAHVHVCIYVMFWTYFHKIHRQTLVLCCGPVTTCMTASACLSVCEALYKCTNVGVFDVVQA